MIEKKSFGIMNPIKVRVDGSLVTIIRAGRKVILPIEQVKGVRYERRSIRGPVLVVDAHTKPIYFKQSAGACEDAMKYLHELAQ